MTPFAVAAELARLKSMFLLLPETQTIYPIWEALVTEHQVSGKPAHDARLVAAMQTHGLTAILTFDKTGFSRYPGIEVVHPEQIKAWRRSVVTCCGARRKGNTEDRRSCPPPPAILRARSFRVYALSLRRSVVPGL
jgi:hypothetical protein